MTSDNSFDSRDTLDVDGERYTFFSLPRAEEKGLKNISRLPYCLQVLLENALRFEDGDAVTRNTITGFSDWVSTGSNPVEISFFPTRIMVHDVSGIPIIADFASMRERIIAQGGNGADVNPARPVDVIMDHSITAEAAGNTDALSTNMRLEYVNNAERYRVVKWAQNSFSNIRVLPPGQGICHQINLEYLSRVIWSERHPDYGQVAFPDSLLGGDSHTPMINALSVLGWGVGGIEALSASLGEPVSMTLPDVVGVRLVGQLREGTTTTDLVLALTRRLREHGVVQKFVEFHGPALDHLSLPERATIANMCPEYGASIGFFPTDVETLDYMHLTGRSDQAPLVEAYCKAQGLWRDDTVERRYTDALEFDLDTVEASLSGPKLPQSQMPLSRAHESAHEAIADATRNRDSVKTETATGISDGDIVIAAITSCTNTSNPSVMLAAGLLARKARDRGLRAKPWVKTSLSPGSRVVGDYLKHADLMQPLEELGFHVTGYGCMTCCGGSGALADDITADIKRGNIVTAAILSGNRNFEGRVHPQAKLAYLGAPPLVVAYAIAGSMLCDITTDSLGNDQNGNPVYLRDIWPDSREIDNAMRAHVTRDMFATRYADPSSGTDLWKALEAGDDTTYSWDPDSTYILKPPFLETFEPQQPMRDINNAATLALLGDNVTTDHISPGSRILPGSLAADYLEGRGETPEQFSGFLQRRCNHDVMLRGAFNNDRIQNAMVPEKTGGWTKHHPSMDTMTIFDAAARYRDDGRPLVVVTGKEYGTGSSRDWAAKGAHLLGVKAIIAESFERIHRSNLVGMGVLPLQFDAGVNQHSLELDGSESVNTVGLADSIRPGQRITVEFTRTDGSSVTADVTCRLDTGREIAWYRAGGVMPYVLDKLYG